MEMLIKSKIFAQKGKYNKSKNNKTLIEKKDRWVEILYYKEKQ